jgi:hypothetical protein
LANLHLLDFDVVHFCESYLRWFVVVFVEGRTRATSLDAAKASWFWACSSLWAFYHCRWISGVHISPHQ